MLVTRLEELKKGRIKVDIDYETAFVLYAKEIQKFNIKEDHELEPEQYAKIEKEILLPRAKNRALYILKFADKTSQELEKSLRSNYYNDRIIEKVMEYVRSYGYVNDTRYTDSYIRLKGTNKSKRQLEMELKKKGIEQDQIRYYMEENEFDEYEGLMRLVHKRLRNKGNLDAQELQKQYAYFARKGYEFGAIKRAIQEYQQRFDDDEDRL